jgi:hypothetical protein
MAEASMTPWLRRRIIDPLLMLLKQGLAPDRVPVVGVLAGIFHGVRRTLGLCKGTRLDGLSLPLRETALFGLTAVIASISLDLQRRMIDVKSLL